jgi:hypothetical protein
VDSIALRGLIVQMGAGCGCVLAGCFLMKGGNVDKDEV